MDPLSRHNVNLSGNGDRFMMFAHGFGCDQTYDQLGAKVRGELDGLGVGRRL